MKMHTDSYFTIGAHHSTAGFPCQDFAISASTGAAACAVVSDGCSTGGLTDVGARILALATVQAIRAARHADASIPTLVQLVVDDQQALLRAQRHALGLDKSDMLATCAYAYLTPRGGFLHVQGDGVVALKFKSGLIRATKYDWGNNTPYYPAYSAGDDIESFVAAHGGLAAVGFGAETVVRALGGVDQSARAEFSVCEGIRGIVTPIPEQDLPDIDLIAVFSDGVSQIENVDWRDAVEEFLAMKNLSGEFVKRRLIRGVKDMRLTGRGPIDDLACAMIHATTEER